MNRKKWAAAMLVLPALHRALHALILLVCTGAAGLHGCRWDAWYCWHACTPCVCSLTARLL